MGAAPIDSLPDRGCPPTLPGFGVLCFPLPFPLSGQTPSCSSNQMWCWPWMTARERCRWFGQSIHFWRCYCLARPYTELYTVSWTIAERAIMTVIAHNTKQRLPILDALLRELWQGGDRKLCCAYQFWSS